MYPTAHSDQNANPREGQRPRTPRVRPSRAAPRADVPHTESYVDSRTGETIRVSCDCMMGRSHSYGEWQGLRVAGGASALGEG